MKPLKLLITYFIVCATSCSFPEETRYTKLYSEVQNYYKESNNPLKLKAALLLLENLDGMYSISGERYSTYSDLIKKYGYNSDTLYNRLKIIQRETFLESKEDDTLSLTADFIIDNIERSFDSWEKASWKNEISFNDFCEYILPYRLRNEPLENWREEISKDTIFFITSDSINAFNSMFKAAAWFEKKYARVKKFSIRWGDNAVNVPHLPYSTLNILPLGTCADLNHITMLVFRAASFPTSHDFTPQWANNRAGHDWAALVKDSDFIPFSLSTSDSLGKFKSPDYIPSKVYRHTLSKNKQSHVALRGTCDFLPYVFNNSRLIDVTHLYVPTKEIELNADNNTEKEKFAYLAVSDHLTWNPVAWGSIKDGKAKFSNITTNAVFLPYYISESRTESFGYPFIVSEKGTIRHLKPDTSNLRTIELTRKYPLRSIINVYTKRMVSGRFQASNDKEFKSAVTFYTIKDDPGLYYNEQKVQLRGKYRYLRYLSGDHCRSNLAEIQFFAPSDTVPLKGTAIGTKGHQPLMNAFDNNDLTYIDTDQIQGSWVGLDLGESKEISRIRFLSRNDKNHVLLGNTYELFYWDNDWKSLGKKLAKARRIFFDKVPANSLLLLRNLTEGKEERIFTYDSGKQVWW